MLVSSWVLFHGIIILTVRGPASKDVFSKNISDFQRLVVLKEPSVTLHWCLWSILLSMAKRRSRKVRLVFYSKKLFLRGFSGENEEMLWICEGPTQRDPYFRHSACIQYSKIHLSLTRAANDTFLIGAPGTRRFIPTHLTFLRLCVRLNLQFIQHTNVKHCWSHQVSLQWISYQKYLF